MDKSRVEPTIFFIEKISFSLKLFSGHFYGQSFIKTVRGPWSAQEMMVLITSACGECSDEPACTHDLARAFGSRINKVCKLKKKTLLDI